MTYEQLRATIIARMMAFTGIDQARIDYQSPGARFEPPADGMWCRLVIETARPVVRGLCQPKARIPGHIIVQCHDRASVQAPTLRLVQLADALASHFQFWRAPGLECRESQLVAVGLSSSVGTPSGKGFTQTNVQTYFLTS